MNGEFIDLLPWFIPLCALASAALVAAINMRPGNKTADEAVAAGQYKRLSDWADKMEEHCKACEEELVACRNENEELRNENINLRAENLELKAGRTVQEQVRQRAAEAVAGDRAARRAEKKD